jgi:hypothetical protein
MKLLIFLLLAASAVGQTTSKHTCRILFLDGPDDAPDKLQLFDGTDCQEVDLPRLNFSKVYPLRPGPLRLLMLPSPPADPQSPPAGAPVATIPGTLTDFYLLVTSDPANPVAPVRLQVIDAGTDRLHAGQMLWLNLTDHTIRGRVGTEKLALKPRSRLTMDPPAASNADYPVNLAYQISGGKHPYPLCETQWRHDPRSRSLAFVIAKPGVRTPRVLVFPDYREAAKRP